MSSDNNEAMARVGSGGMMNADRSANPESYADDGIIEDLEKNYDEAFPSGRHVESDPKQAPSSQASEKPQAAKGADAARKEDDELAKDVERAMERTAPGKETGKAAQYDLGHIYRNVDHAMAQHLKAEAYREGDFATVDAIERVQFLSYRHQVQHFAEERGPDGKPLHPHFDEVAKDIGALLRSSRQDGRSLTLAQAYDAVVWANPKTREKVEAAAREAKVAQAKAAADPVAGVKVKRERDSITAALERSFDAQSARARQHA